MINFIKAAGSEEYYKLDLAAFLAGEGTGVTIAAIESFALASGDASGLVLGTSTRAPAIVGTGTAVLFWLTGGTAGETGTLNVRLRLSNTEEFPWIIKVRVVSSR